jgi:hypothetical protein
MTLGDDQMHSNASTATSAPAEGQGGAHPCEGCGTPFKRARRWQRFCGKNCRNEWHRREKMGPTGRLEDLERRVKALEERTEVLP